ncbi:hypothetical protein Nepgr_008306 [Nepenthes gracilis]|uniref:Uncharacterized protein n=1 Tax=Nepenthes gracilis TaxID=150966 RepID=A0AAD3XJB4_NEPGR|nr:hypothetical protein Nepgr_008306 [Nepenthes gracilis]
MEMEMISQASAAEAFAAYFASSLQEKDVGGRGSSGRSAFQWGASFSALFLLILNQLGRKSTVQASLLILYLITSFPTALFKILRGQFGCWVAFLAVIGNLTFPHIIPVSRVPLFVIIPDWLASELRDSIVGAEDWKSLVGWDTERVRQLISTAYVITVYFRCLVRPEMAFTGPTFRGRRSQLPEKSNVDFVILN